ncbi:uncharacterized protein METZ01_LOCUS386232 [marine metagenome]|uniref:Uncharacterized protein n=1 Tax=marine metagenome TaxID=408172 RepID=A0A382UI62_9ZZZZ
MIIICGRVNCNSQEDLLEKHSINHIMP